MKYKAGRFSMPQVLKSVLISANADRTTFGIVGSTPTAAKAVIFLSTFVADT
jgi:hypothetical protein